MEVFTLKIKDKLDDSFCKSLLSLIDESKCDRLLKFVYQKDLQRGLFADLLVRKALIEKFNWNNDDIYFSVNEYGKPYCEFIKDFHFNVSHSGDWVVCAIDNNPVGIDVEKISTIDLEISKNFFSKKEHEDLMLSKNPFDYFFTLWSLKESYIKFIGKGLSHPLNSFSMRLSSNNIYIESYDNILTDIYFKQYDIDKEYKMAVCSSNKNMPEQVVMCNISEVIKPFVNMKIET